MKRLIKKGTWCLAGLVLALGAAQAVQAQFSIPIASFSNGTQLATAGGDRLFGTLGQTLAGLTTNPDNYIGGGFWFALQPELPSTVATEGDEAGLPTAYQLDATFPNPFVPATGAPTHIRFGLPEPAPVHLAVYNMLGQEVITLVQDRQPAGWFTVAWDGRDAQGTPMASGLYLYQLRAEAFTATRKLILIR